MRIVGIITEYNPFHNGHAWHIRRTRELTGCDCVVACMAGHFTQRGDPTPLSKWSRTRMALACGVDAVFELPALFAVRPADAFAMGGVAILDGIGADGLSFGSEIADPDALRALAEIRAREPEPVSEAVRAGLARGMSHARAWGEAVGAYLGIDPDSVHRPNLILASEYLRAIDALDSGMQPLAVPRMGDYHGGQLGEFASASAIRAALARGENAAAMEAVPETSRRFFDPESLHPMDDLLMLRLREMSPEQLAALPGVAEGLEHRLYRLCRKTSTREELLDALKCKRYTRARLSRLLTHALLGLRQGDLDACPLPTCARLLGFRRGAEPLLGELERRSKLPIVSAPGKLREDPCFAWECRATDIWSLLHDAPDQRLPGREFTEKFILA